MKSRRIYYIDRITSILLKTSADRIRIEELAAAIGVTKKTLYNYFDSKQQLSECIIDSYIRQKISDIRASIRNWENPIVILLMISEILNNAYKDCNHILITLGKIRYTDSYVQIVEANQKELIEITEHIFKKGIREGLFDINIDTILASKFFLSGIQMLLNPNSLINLMVESKEKHKQIIFYMLKGSCTQKGLQQLRQMFDIKVMLSDNNHEETAISSEMLVI